MLLAYIFQIKTNRFLSFKSSLEMKVLGFVSSCKQKLCWSSQDTIFSPSSPSPPSAVHDLTGKLLLQSMQNSLEKEQLHQQLVVSIHRI